MTQDAFRNLHADSQVLKSEFPGHHCHWSSSCMTQVPDILLAVIMQDIPHTEHDAAALTYFSSSEQSYERINFVSK